VSRQLLAWKPGKVLCNIQFKNKRAKLCQKRCRKMTFSYGFPASRQKLCNMEKNVHKKIEKICKKLYVSKKKTFSFAALPLTSSTSTNKTHEKLWNFCGNQEPFAFFFLSYTTHYKREEWKRWKTSILKTLEKKSWPTKTLKSPNEKRKKNWKNTH